MRERTEVTVRGVYLWVVVGLSAVVMMGGASVVAEAQRATSPVVIGGATVSNGLTVDDAALRSYEAAGGKRQNTAGRVGCYSSSASDCWRAVQTVTLREPPSGTCRA